MEPANARKNQQELEWIAESEAAARRTLQQRMKYAFIKTYKPVLDDAPLRSFDTMADSRCCCEKNLPPWLRAYFGRRSWLRPAARPRCCVARTRRILRIRLCAKISSFDLAD